MSNDWIGRYGWHHDDDGFARPIKIIEGWTAIDRHIVIYLDGSSDWKWSVMNEHITLAADEEEESLLALMAL